MSTTDSSFNTAATSVVDQSNLVLDTYEKIDYHWFYSKCLQEKTVWLPFSFKDSKNLEAYYQTNKDKILELRNVQEANENHLVQVQGGRFDVDLITLIKRPVYWDGKDSEIKRCLWFYKESNEQRFVPYSEDYSEFLEKHYERIFIANTFHEQIKHPVNQDESFIFHSTKIMLHFVQSSGMVDEFGNLNSDAQRPRIMKRGISEVADKIEPDETDEVDHLCFIVHGIGEGCDMRFRPIVDCVDDFREISEFIIQNYFKTSREIGKINRIEFLPISWHDDLHASQFGSDNRLNSITLKWIPKLRKFANTTISDVLFYTSPIYCQLIVNKVGSELNMLHKRFLQRNKNFKGNVSLIGHSLGSLILFDLLTHQVNVEKPSANQAGHMENIRKTEQTDFNLEAFLAELDLEDHLEKFEKEKIDSKSLFLLTEEDLQKIGLPLGSRRIVMKAIATHISKNEREKLDREIKTNLANFRTKTPEVSTEPKTDYDYSYGLAGTGQLLIKYPQIEFPVENFFALGSPIPMFLTVRGVDNLSADFKFPTCKGFFNIFHPYDPIAYRIEPLIKPDIQVEPVLMPHHLGRKRMHLELREGLTKVGGDLKQKMMEKLKFTWSSLQDFANYHKTDGDADQTHVNPEESGVDVTENTENATSIDELNIKIGNLNHGGRRVDYVLQERPIESFNEYLFALTSHGSYWSSEDTLMLVVKEVYSNREITPDTLQQPSGIAAFEQHSMSIAHAAASTISSTFSFFKSSLLKSNSNPNS